MILITIHFYDYLCETSLSKEGKNSTLGYLFEKLILKEVGYIKVLSRKFLSQKAIIWNIFKYVIVIKASILNMFNKYLRI